MKYLRRSALVTLITVIAVAAPLSAQTPRTISQQGLLTDPSGDPVPDASRTMTFKIYNTDSGGSALWTESKSVATVNGVFNTILGSSTPQFRASISTRICGSALPSLQTAKCREPS